MARAHPKTRRWNRRTKARAASPSRIARPATNASSDASHTLFVRPGGRRRLAEGPIPPIAASVCSDMRKILILLGAVAVFVAGCGGGGSSKGLQLCRQPAEKGKKGIFRPPAPPRPDEFHFKPPLLKAGNSSPAVPLC